MAEHAQPEEVSHDEEGSHGELPEDGFEVSARHLPAFELEYTLNEIRHKRLIFGELKAKDGLEVV